MYGWVFPRLRTPPSLTWLWSRWLKNYLCRVTPRSIQRFGLLNVLAPWFSSLLFWWWSTILPYHTREHIHIKYEICTVCLYDIHVYMNVFNYDQIGATAATLKALHFHLCCWMGNPQSFWSITETPQVGCIPIPRSNHGQKNHQLPLQTSEPEWWLCSHHSNGYKRSATKLLTLWVISIDSFIWWSKTQCHDVLLSCKQRAKRVFEHFSLWNGNLNEKSRETCAVMQYVDSSPSFLARQQLPKATS